MSSSTLVERESEILERLVVSPESAEAVLSLRFSPADERRMQTLMDKNNKGTLTDDERHEMECYRRIGNLLGILQAKARVLLKQSRDA